MLRWEPHPHPVLTQATVQEWVSNGQTAIRKLQNEEGADTGQCSCPHAPSAPPGSFLAQFRMVWGLMTKMSLCQACFLGAKQKRCQVTDHPSFPANDRHPPPSLTTHPCLPLTSHHILCLTPLSSDPPTSRGQSEHVQEPRGKKTLLKRGGRKPGLQAGRIKILQCLSNVGNVLHQSGR